MCFKDSDPIARQSWFVGCVAYTHHYLINPEWCVHSTHPTCQLSRGACIVTNEPQTRTLHPK